MLTLIWSSCFVTMGSSKFSSQIMTNDDAILDSVNAEEDIFSPRGRSIIGTRLRRTKEAKHIPSTYDRMHNYDNLDTSWILGTRSFERYQMFPRHGSSSEKSRENQPPSREGQMRVRTEDDRPNRELTERNGRDYDLRKRSERKKNLREKMKRNDGEIKVKTEALEKAHVRPPEEKYTRARKSNRLGRLRKGPITRLYGSSVVKNVKNQAEENETDEDSSQENKKDGNNSENEDVYTDINTQIKRNRRTSQRQLTRNKIVEDSDMSESSDMPAPRRYSLRQKKPTLDRFQANVEPARQSIGALRSVLSNSVRKRKNRSKSSSSSDSSDSSDYQPQRYNKNKSRRSRVKPERVQCGHCGYESNRKFNVWRHENRVHRRLERIMICCRRQFMTKGELYAHIEIMHPETKRSMAARTKYKIVKPFLYNYRLGNRKQRVKNFEAPGRILTQDVEVKDEDITWPPKEMITEYLSDIKFELFKVSLI